MKRPRSKPEAEQLTRLEPVWEAFARQTFRYLALREGFSFRLGDGNRLNLKKRLIVLERRLLELGERDLAALWPDLGEGERRTAHLSAVLRALLAGAAGVLRAAGDLPEPRTTRVARIYSLLETRRCEGQMLNELPELQDAFAARDRTLSLLHLPGGELLEGLSVSGRVPQWVPADPECWARILPLAQCAWKAENSEETLRWARRIDALLEEGSKEGEGTEGKGKEDDRDEGTGGEKKGKGTEDGGKRKETEGERSEGKQGRGDPGPDGPPSSSESEPDSGGGKPGAQGEGSASTPGPGRSASAQHSSEAHDPPPARGVEERSRPGSAEENDEGQASGLGREENPGESEGQNGQDTFESPLERRSNEDLTPASDETTETRQDGLERTDEACVPQAAEREALEGVEAAKEAPEGGDFAQQDLEHKTLEEGELETPNPDEDAAQDAFEEDDPEDSNESQDSEPDLEHDLETLIAFDALEESSSSPTNATTQAGVSGGSGPKQGDARELPDLEDGHLEPQRPNEPAPESPPETLEHSWDPIPPLSPAFPSWTERHLSDVLVLTGTQGPDRLSAPCVPHPALRPPNLTRFAFELAALLRPARRPRSRRATHGRGTLDPVRFLRGFERLYLQGQDPGRPLPVALHLLIDTSSSMDAKGRLLEAKKCAASLLMAGEEAGSEVELLGFGNGVTVIKTAQDSTDTALGRLERLGAYGGTSLEGALGHTLQSVSGQSSDGAALVVFLSDGDLCDLPACQQLLQSFRAGLHPRPETRFLALLIGGTKSWSDLGVEVVQMRSLSAAAGHIRATLERVRDDLERQEGY